MSIEEKKQLLQDKICSEPNESKLDTILAILNHDYDSKPTNITIDLAKHKDSIIEKNHEVFKRLA